MLALSLGSLGRTSPGQLTAVHTREAELSSKRDCVQCHGGITSSMTDACLECHQPIRDQLAAGEGLHGTLEGRAAKSCALCHSEHHGERFDIVNRRSYALAGVEDPEDFDHALVGFPMDGNHLELECTECHANADAPVLPAGERRFVGLDWDCATCHEDEHQGEMKLDCAQCHSQTAFAELASHGHERYLPLVGAHGALDCAECHEDQGPRSLMGLGRRGQRRPLRRCTDCHESPHREDLVAGVAAELAVVEAGSCVACHLPEHESWRDEVDMADDLHALAGFALDAPHDEVTCAECHSPDLADFERRHPGRRADDCVACHEDPHGGQFEDGPFAEPGCIACHDRARFEPHAFAAEEHARAAFALTDRHLEAECDQCHRVLEEGAPRVFRGTETRCEQCHEDAHEGFFDERRGAALAAVEAGTCARCHDAESFGDVPEPRFDHGHWTGLPVEGAHAQVECEACHVPAEEPDAFGRTFGRVRDEHGSYDGCVTCHADPHEGRFDAIGLPEKHRGRTGCARCHVQTSFRTFPGGFDHGLWTGFPLDGAHGEAECSACHAPYTHPDASGRTWGPALGSACQDCHADSHGGQFLRDGVTECARCHRAAVRFTSVVFDHDRQSRFPLGEAHSKLACAECHEPWPLPGGGELVRYRPIEHECNSCHGAHHEQTRRR